MTSEQVVQIVQVSYPQIYLACHTRHQRKRSTAHSLSPRDGAILAHLSEVRPIKPSKLADHLGVTRSTVSEALHKLKARGFIRTVESDAGRIHGVTLSAKGQQAIRDTSVLETRRLQSVLADATREDLRIIGAGIGRLAALCREKSSNHTHL